MKPCAAPLLCVLVCAVLPFRVRAQGDEDGHGTEFLVAYSFSRAWIVRLNGTVGLGAEGRGFSDYCLLHATAPDGTMMFLNKTPHRPGLQIARLDPRRTLGEDDYHL